MINFIRAVRTHRVIWPIVMVYRACEDWFFWACVGYQGFCELLGLVWTGL